jgi:hypothetical protein
MHHERDRDAWRITGLVRNPAQNPEVSNVTAVAFLFGRDGTFLGSGRAPLDFTRLAPGDEAGFAIAVEVPGQVARYRLSFRAADGAIFRHVDRRAPAGTSG